MLHPSLTLLRRFVWQGPALPQLESRILCGPLLLPPPQQPAAHGAEDDQVRIVLVIIYSLFSL